MSRASVLPLHGYLPRAYDDHRIVLRVSDPAVGLTAFIAIHRAGRMPSFGATRIWRYSNEQEAFSDALSLSKTMSYKSALAGFPYGGAKGVIVEPQTPYGRTALLRSYVRFVDMLGGRFVTGADVGVGITDVKYMAKYSSAIVGSHVDPVAWTVKGYVRGLRVVCRERFGTESLVGRSIAIQGLGKTGKGVLDAIYGECGRIMVTDVNPKVLADVVKAYPRVKTVAPQTIYMQSVDIFAPCALGGIINETTIDRFRCKAVVGTANGQLTAPDIGERLFHRHILYASDYLVNSGGLIAVVDEYRHSKPDDRRIAKRVSAIGHTLAKIFKESNVRHIPPHRIADQKAEKIFNTL